MLAQIEELSKLSFEDKVKLVDKGLAYIDAEGSLFLSLRAVSNLGIEVVSHDPFVRTAQILDSNKIECTYAADPGFSEAEDALALTHDYLRTISTAIQLGYPVPRIADKMMSFYEQQSAESAKDEDIDHPFYADVDEVRTVLKEWKDFIESKQASKLS